MSKRRPLSLFSKGSSASSSSLSSLSASTPSSSSSSSSSSSLSALPHLHSSSSSPAIMADMIDNDKVDINDISSSNKKDGVDVIESDAPKGAKVLSKPTTSSSPSSPSLSGSGSEKGLTSSERGTAASKLPTRSVASARPKSSVSSSKDQSKVSITLSAGEGKEAGEDTAKSSSPSTSTSSSSSSSSSSSTPSILQKIRAAAKPAGSKHSTLPLPPKSKFPASSGAKPPASAKPGAAKYNTMKPAPTRALSQAQLQQQAQDLQLQLEIQKGLLEQQQKELQHHQLTQQQLEVKLQQTNEEKQLQQQILEQQLWQSHLEQQLQQTRLKQQLEELNSRIQTPQFSPQARTFIAQYPFQSHHADKQPTPSPSEFVQGGKYVVDFAFTPANAMDAYRDWKDSQWMLPQGFATSQTEAMISMHIPFYSFSLFSHSVHSGRGGHFKQASDSTAVQFSAMEFDFDEERMQSSPISQLHPNVLVYAPTFNLVTTPDYDLMQEIWYWNVDDIALKPHALARSSLSLPTRTNSSASIDVKVLPSISIPEAWTYAKKKLLKNEQYCAAQTLKKECKCDVVQDVQTDTTFSHIVVKLIYLPVYVWTNAYQGTTYHTVMNGQNGIVSGRRPYALKSSWDSIIKLIAGGEQVMSKTENITGAISGLDLTLRDNYTKETTPYRLDLWYLVFPPSDQFLVVVATGWVRVVNTSETESAVVTAQKRLSVHAARSLSLAPLQEATVAYRGAWCLCVVEGDPQSVMISFISTNSGADKEDSLGMV